MTGSSVLPVSLHEDKLYFLFGKENDKEDSAKGFSDFGGGIEKGETQKDTAIREGAEELTGFLGDPTELKNLIKNNGGLLEIKIPDYYTHVFYLQYDPKLPIYYNNNHKFLWDKMNKDVLNETKLFEKIEIQWFTIEDMKNRTQEFRGFYQKMVAQLLQSEKRIKKFVKKNSGKKNSGKKNRTLKNK
jgi:8-oxo-dGTP pyrophosphatase MutT (NUDIX family)